MRITVKTVNQSPIFSAERQSGRVLYHQFFDLRASDF
jgi:hypothetical protein